MFTGRTINILHDFTFQTNLSVDLSHMLQAILSLGFCVVLIKGLNEETEAITAGCLIASFAISFASIKPII